MGNAALGLYASPAYLKARGRPRSLADLADHDCVLFRGKHGKALWRLEGPHGEPASVEVRGPINVDDPRIILPPKSEVYSTIEGTIQHFKIVMEGLKLPAGEVYSYTEGGNGELGFYIVADGTGRPSASRVSTTGPACWN